MFWPTRYRPNKAWCAASSTTTLWRKSYALTGVRPCTAATSCSATTTIRACENRPPMPHAEPARPLATTPVDLDPGYAMDAKTLRRLSLFAAVLLCIALAFGAYWLLHARFLESTDNAYVRADIVVVSSQLAARITRVQVEDNQWVEAGDTLARLDDADFVYQEQRIQTQIDDLQVQLHSLTNQHAQQQARIEAHAAEVQASSAELGRQQGNLERIRALRRRS